MENYNERLGLGFLKRKGGEQQQSEKQDNLPPFMEEALIAYGRKILETLKTYGGSTGTVFQLIDDLGARIETLMPVVKHLIDKGYLTLVQDDSKGNYTVKLTDAGKKLAS